MRPFEEIVAEHGPVVLRVCRALLGPADAQDAWSETFLSALRAYPDLRPDSDVRAWLVTIAHRRAIDQGRKASRAPRPVGDVPEAPSTDGAPPPGDDDLLAALATLPPKQRGAVAYRYLADLSYDQVADLLGSSPAAARRSAADGIAALRRTYLRGEDPVSPASRTRTDAAVAADLVAALPVEVADVAALSAGLADRAEREGLLDVAYRTVETPFGPLLLAATPQGLVRVAFELEGHDAVLAQLASMVSPRVLRSPGRTDDVARQLDEYFAGRRRRFEVPVDLQLVRGFRREVVAHLPEIAYGATESYAAVAAATGNPAAVRAVGSACSHNPIPVVIPCHRVVRSDGTIGQYLGGTEVKRALLALEAGAT